MRKLALDPDTLRVESFETVDPGGARRGTVPGFVATVAPAGAQPTPTLEPTGCTCFTVCNDTCYSCPTVCPKSCPSGCGETYCGTCQSCVTG